MERVERLPPIAFAPPAIGEEEIEAVVDTLRSGWLTTGPKTHEFERQFAEFVGAPAALGLNSCTAALHIALAAFGVKPGDGVITTPMTFCSTVHVIEQVGAIPVLVDVEPDTLNLNPDLVAESLRRATIPIRAILPVHYAGHPCDMSRIQALAAANNLAVIEDAAHALPASEAGRMVGAVTEGERRAVCFSFYATKNMTTGEGGMLVGDTSFVDEARLWSLHGMTRDAASRYSAGGTWRYGVVRPGFKYNMTDIAAALGIVQLKKLSSFHRRRTEIAQRYSQALALSETIEVPTTRSTVQHAWHLYVLRVRGADPALRRQQFIDHLAERRIGTSVHFIPIHMHDYYRQKYGWAPHDFPVAAREFERMLSLPIHPLMTDADVERVIEACLEIAGTEDLTIDLRDRVHYG